MHAGQRYVDAHSKRFTLLSAGRRWRKTTYMASKTVIRSLERRGEYIIGAPTYKQVRVPWGELHTANRSGHIKFNESRMEATMPNGSLIHFVSLDNPDNARGLTAMGVGIDEYGDVHPDAWSLVLAPMLVDTGGWALKIGTPKGRNHFYREFHAALSGDAGPEYAAFNAPTRGVKVVNDALCLDANGRLIAEPHALENPFVPFTEIIKLHQQSPERFFRQEILAEFLLDGGGVFRGVRSLLDPTLEVLEAPIRRGSRYILGVDLAKSMDYTVVVVLDQDTKTVVNLYRWNHESWPLIKAKIAYLSKLFNNGVIWIDSTGVGDPIYDDLARASLPIHPYKFTEASRGALIDHTILCVEQKLFRMPKHQRFDVLVNEMEAMEYRQSPTGRLRPDHPEGLHDDTVWALSLALWPLNVVGSIPNSMLHAMDPIIAGGVIDTERYIGSGGSGRLTIGRRL